MVDFIDKRKNYRFPAFDDDGGVKLPKTSGRVLFGDEFKTVFSDSISNPEPIKTSVPVEPTYEERYFTHEPERVAQVVTKEADFSYQGPPIKESVVEVKKPVFYSDHRASLEKKLQEEKKVDERSTSNAQPGKYKGRSYFVPKHIPSSIIPVEVSPSYSRQELLDRMKKPKSSYIVMEEETDRAFQYDEIEKKEISSFEVKDEKNDIPFTRREFKKLKKEQVGVKEDNNTPAFTKKQQTEKNANKNSRLEKSLSGIMNDETTQSKSNKYFD